MIRHRLALPALLSFFLGACSESPPPAASPVAKAVAAGPVALDYLGSEACAECHQEAFEAWQGSHHQLAMQTLEHGPVLGDFDTTLDHLGEQHAFLTVDGRPVIETDDAEGERRQFPVSHVFGVEPLQQYLVAFPDGHYQIPALSWDSRPADEGAGSGAATGSGSGAVSGFATGSDTGAISAVSGAVGVSSSAGVD